jgi:predicted  nucleic acid-binding Zn-ribbon protein
LWHYERHIPKGSENNDPELAKLNLALEAVKEDILSTNKQINDERRWVIAVSKIISSYNSKAKRVEAHIIALRKEMKNLYRKKKQIENLKLQKALEAKLKEARAELATLTNSLKHVAVKQGELNKSGRDLRQTIAGIQGQLAKLRGQQLHKAKKCRWGRRYNLMKRKCVRICKKGQRLSKKTKKCVARKCKKGMKWNKKTKKCAKKSKKAKKF